MQSRFHVLQLRPDSAVNNKYIYIFLKPEYTLNDLAVLLLGIYQKELTFYVHIKSCTQVFIVSLFIVAKIRCPSVGE